MLFKKWVQMPSQPFISPAEVIAQVHAFLEDGTDDELDLTLLWVGLEHMYGGLASPQHRAYHYIADLNALCNPLGRLTLQDPLWLQLRIYLSMNNKFAKITNDSAVAH